MNQTNQLLLIRVKFVLTLRKCFGELYDAVDGYDHVVAYGGLVRLEQASSFMLNIQPLLCRYVFEADDILSERPINSAKTYPLATNSVNHSLFVCLNVFITLNKRYLTLILNLYKLLHLKDQWTVHELGAVTD